MTARLACALAFALALTAPSAAHAFSWEGTCDQVGVDVLAEAKAVRKHVPEGWPLHEVNGKVVLFVTGGACRDQYVNGTRVGESHFGLVNVPSRHPDKPDPGHSYDIWWFNSDVRVARAMSDAGITAAHVPGLRASTVFETTVATRATSGKLSVPWRESRYSVRVDPAPVTTPPWPLPFTSYHWHVGGQGRILLTPEHTLFTITTGTGVLEVPAGTPIARMIGGTRATGLGVLFSFAFKGSGAPA